jgi:uncharacterized protein (TIGR02284 family)
MGLLEQEAAPTILRNLLETCRESEAGFLRAASRSKKTGLREFFGAEALQQALFAAELELELKKLGVAMKHLTRPRAKLRGWKEIRGTRLLPAGDKTVLFLCEWGERAALEEYLTALQSGLPAETLELVERQYSQLQEASKRLDQIHEQMRNDERVVEHQNSRMAEPDGRGKDNAQHRAP